MNSLLIGIKQYILYILCNVTQTHTEVQTDSGHFRCNFRSLIYFQLPPKSIILANNIFVSIGYYTGIIQYDLTVVRMNYASYRDVGICLNIIGRWPSWNYLVKVAIKGFNRIRIIYSHLKQHIYTPHLPF